MKCPEADWWTCVTATYFLCGCKQGIRTILTCSTKTCFSKATRTRVSRPRYSSLIIMTDQQETQALITTGATAIRKSSCPWRGFLRLIASQLKNENLLCFEYEYNRLTDSQYMLQKRRRRSTRPRGYDNATVSSSSHTASFDELTMRHRFVCFFVIQGNASHFYSHHSLFLRQRLAQDFHDVMTTFLVSLGNGHGEENDAVAAGVEIFSQGTGFCYLPETPFLRSLLNISQVPCIIVVDTTTKDQKKMSQDAMLAIEWNNPHHVINAWQRGQSGLTWTQKIMAVITLQSSPCVIQ